MLVFPWDDIGYPTVLNPSDVGHKIEHPYAGYYAVRPGAAKIQKAFEMAWEKRTTAQWLAFVEFWRSVFADAFYFEFPAALYGSPGYGGYGGVEPPDGFDADYDTGFGGGPSFIAVFVGDTLPQEWQSGGPGRWGWRATVREFA